MRPQFVHLTKPWRRRVATAFLLSTWLAIAHSADPSPTVFWASDPVDAGEMAMVIGDSFESISKVRLLRISDKATGFPSPSDWGRSSVQVPVVQGGNTSLKFVIPSGFGSGVTAVRVNAGGREQTVYLNRPTVYWSQGDGGTIATRGGWVRVFGRNIGVPGLAARLGLTGPDRKARVINATGATRWDAKFPLPKDIPPGTYLARLHNGWGGAIGWSDVGNVVIADVGSQSWPTRIFNVREFGAKGSGSEDDTRAVAAALTAAGQNGGGVVFFPRGRYRLSAAIEIPRQVTLHGESRELSSIQWDDFKTPPPVLLKGGGHFAIEDLTLYASNYVHLIASELGSPAIGAPGNVRLERLIVRAVRYRGHLKPEEVDEIFRGSLKADGDGGDAIALGGEDLRVVDCDIYASGRSIFLFRPKRALVTGNRFYNGRWGWYSISGADGVIFENNEIMGADLMATGGGINNLRGPRVSQNVWFAKNKLSLFHGWDREAMTSDAGGGFYYGKVKEVKAASFDLVDAPARPVARLDEWAGAGVFILGGKGMGQYAQVTTASDTHVEVDRPWKIAPDDSSVVTITPLQRNYLFIENQFQDAGVAIQFYGTSVNHVVAGNKATRAGSFYSSGRWYQHYQPSWFNQFFDNEIVDGSIYRGGPNNATFSGEAVLGTYGLQRAPNPTPLSLGTVFRRNKLRGNAHIEVVGVDPRAPGVQDVIVENNTVENASVGLKIDGGVTGLVARRNIFRNVDIPVQNASAADRANIVE
jgi:pectate lyase-like protein